MRVVRQASSLGGARTQSVDLNNCSYSVSFRMIGEKAPSALLIKLAPWPRISLTLSDEHGAPRQRSKRLCLGVRTRMNGTCRHQSRRAAVEHL
jgi:hypothetical protein